MWSITSHEFNINDLSLDEDFWSLDGKLILSFADDQRNILLQYTGHVYPFGFSFTEFWNKTKDYMVYTIDTTESIFTLYI